MIDRETLRLNVIQYTCMNRCMGIAGNSSGCCFLGDRDYIIGPIRDAGSFRERVSKELGRAVTHAELFIDYPEGSALFPERPTWQEAANYPAMRFAPTPHRPCQFYDARAGCKVHEIRPDTCRAYQCAPLRQLVGNF